MMEFLEEWLIFLRISFELLVIIFVFIPRSFKRNKFILRVALSMSAGVILNIPLALIKFTEWEASNPYLSNILKFSFGMVIPFLIVPVCYKIKFSTLLFLALFGTSLQHWGATLNNIVIILLGPVGEITVIGYLTRLIAYCAVLLLSYKLYGKKFKSSLTVHYELLNVILIFVTISIVNLLMLLLEINMDDVAWKRALVYAIDLLIGFGILLLHLFVSKSMVKAHNDRVARALLEQENKQFESLKHSTEAVNSKFHDLKYYVEMFKQSGHFEADTLSELEKIVDEYGSNIQTGSRTLDIVLSEKSKLCNGNNIHFVWIADGNAINFMSEADIFSLFGNALDNAIEYLLQVPEEDKRYVRLKVNVCGNFISISVINYYENQTDNNTGTWQTTKKDKGLHGFGIKNMRSIAEKYEGELDIVTEDKTFSVNIIIPVPKETEKNN